MTIHITKLHVPGMVQRVDGERVEHDFSIDSLGDINILIGRDNYVLEEVLYYIREATLREPAPALVERLFCSVAHYSEVPHIFNRLITLTKNGSQVFISTQNLDLVNYVMKTYQYLKVEPDIDIKFMRVGQSALKADNSKLISVIYNRDRFRGLLRHGAEIR